MNIVFLSNYLNHHQKPVSDRLYHNTNGEFIFVQTKAISNERIQLGYQNSYSEAYLKTAYTDAFALNDCKKEVSSAGVVIYGSAPYSLIKQRLHDGKITVAYSERICKKKSDLWMNPFRLIKYYIRYGKYKNLYLLCASAYAASDYAKLASYRGRTYKWGYFPKAKHYLDIHQLILNKFENSIIWVARMIDWKHPELPIMVARRLKLEGYQFEMSLIGRGVMEHQIIAMINDYSLNDCVHYLGSMAPEQVREHMERSQIHLFTSDRNEGWGAVLNESMNSGCAVVASHVIGSAAFLIEHKKNGLLYEDGNFESLYLSVKELLDNRKYRNELGLEAYRTITELWNAEIAADRLMVLIEELKKHGSCDKFDKGPCSRAEVLKDDWFKG